MKKAITILAVLIVLVGAVFATNSSEAHSIKLHTTIAEVLPVFQFSNTALTGAKNSAGATVANVVKTTNTTNGGTEFTNTASYNEGPVEVGDLSKYGISATFTVSVANQAKTVRSFGLAFEAGAFEVSRGKVAGTHPAASHSASPASRVEADGVTVSGSGDALTADFNGTTLSATAANRVLGTYEVTYNADPTIDPSVGNTTENAQGQVVSYTADIKVTITTAQ